MLKLEVLLGSFLECFLIIGTGLSFIGIYLKFADLIRGSIITGVIVFAIRIFYVTNNISLGSHTFICMFIFIIYIKFVFKISTLKSFISVLVSIILILWGEGIFLPLLRPLIPKINKELGVTSIVFLVSHCFLIFFFFMNYVMRKTIIKFSILKDCKDDDYETKL